MGLKKNHGVWFEETNGSEILFVRFVLSFRHNGDHAKEFSVGGISGPFNFVEISGRRWH